MNRLAFFICCMSSAMFFNTYGSAWAESPVLKKTFPRLVGMNISARPYNDQRYQEELSRLDIVILGFGPQQSRQTVLDTVRAIKKRNPRILIGQYTILDEVYDNLAKYAGDKDKNYKLDREDWWLRNVAGRKVQSTNEYGTSVVNITAQTKPDNQGLRYPQWAAMRDYKMYFELVPEFDIWYFDNVNYKPRVVADWDQDGRDDDPKDLTSASAYRKGHVAHWEAAQALSPTRLLLGNADNDLSYDEFRGKLGGVFFEALMGKSWSLETFAGWEKMMQRYFAGFENTAAPHLVGFNVWGDLNDYKFFRYAYASCLMGDGYFSFTDKNKAYGSVPWFDEYSVDLGGAISPPQKAPWYKGLYKRTFEKGVAIVNPTARAVDIELVEPLYLLAGTQDKQVNHGRRVSKLTIQSKDGIILSRSSVIPRN